MFADVIVDKPQDPTKSVFTYKIPSLISKNIKVGHYVEIPWGKKTASGIVFEIKNITKIKSPKEISRILFPIPLLLPYHIKLLKWMSWYYHAPMVDCLKVFLPEIPKKAIKETLKQSNEGSEVDFAQEQLQPEFKKNELSLLAVGPEAKRNPRGRPQNGLLADENERMRVRHNQTIILVPNINQIPLILADLEKSKNIIIYHSELKPLQKFECWVKMLEGNFDIVIGSRSAVFSPTQNLSEIIIKDENEESYKDQRSPYFNAISVALAISRLISVKLTLESQTPNIETFYFFQKNKNPNWKLKMSTVYSLPVLPRRQAGGKAGLQTTNRIKIVDILEERKSNNYSLFSDTLKDTMIHKLRKYKNILLYLNRKIEAGHLFCPQCLTSNYAISNQILCPNCQNPMLKFYSLNINKIKEELQTILPSNIKTSVVEADLKYTSPSPITIATSAILYNIIPQKFDLVGVISADTILNFPDFKSQERTFQTLWHLSNLLSKNGEMLIQTSNPKNPAIKFAAEKNYRSFFQNEISNRRQFFYPPFSKIVKITVSAKKDEQAFEKAETLVKKIKDLSQQKAEVLGPNKQFSKNFSKTSYNIILKSKNRDDFQPILEIVPLDSTVNVDPKDTL